MSMSVPSLCRPRAICHEAKPRVIVAGQKGRGRTMTIETRRAWPALLLTLGCAGIAAGCAQQQTTKSVVAQSGAGSSTEVKTSGLAEQEAVGPGNFPPPPAGYRSLGRTFLQEQEKKIIVVMPPEGQPDAQRDDEMASLAFNTVVGSGAMEDESDFKVRTADCQGSGETPESAIKVATGDEVEGSQACARLRHPGSRWLTEQFIAKADTYISQVVLRDASGRIVIVYVDVSRYVKQVLSEVHG
jgi:hypothetical protein